MDNETGLLGTKIKVASGRYVDLVNPDPLDIDLESIAHSLSKTCRYGGHPYRFYSVAEHSILVAFSGALDMSMPHEHTKALLMHDATEAYLGDVVKPLKVRLPEYQILEARFQRVIGEAFGIDFDAASTFIKKHDRILLKAEKRELWPEDREQWSGLSEVPDTNIRLNYWEPDEAAERFLVWANALKVGR